jgi:hypothetical protein
MSMINTIRSELTNFGTSTIDAASEIKLGVLLIAEGTGRTVVWIASTASTAGSSVIGVAEGASLCLYDAYNLKFDGLEKTLKFALATLTTATWVFKLGGKFDPAIKAFKDQKDFFYATKVIGTLQQICDPEYKKRGLDKLMDVLLGIGNILDTAKYLKKNEVLSFTFFCNLGKKIGNIQVFTGVRKDQQNLSFVAFFTPIKDIPLLNSICDSPKDLFIFAASFIELKKNNDTLNGIRKKEAHAAATGLPINTFEERLGVYLKFVGTIGKIALISLSKTRFGKPKAFVLVDFATQSAGIVKYMMDGFIKRREKFYPRRLPVEPMSPGDVKFKNLRAAAVLSDASV